MTTEEAQRISREIIQAVRENAAKLSSCPGPHVFERIEPQIFSRFECKICKGRVDSTSAHWYQRGMEHARR